MTHEEAKAYKQMLDDKCTEISKVLNSFPRNEMGMTPDHIRELPEWKKANEEFKKAFAALRNFNGWYVKTFRKRNSKRIERNAMQNK